MMSATSAPSPAPMIAAVGVSISAHSGTALGFLITDHHDRAARDFSTLEAGQHVFLRIVDARRTEETVALFPRDLGNRSVRGKVAAENLNVAVRQDRVIDLADHTMFELRWSNRGEVLCQRLARDGYAASIEEAVLEQVLHQGRRSAACVQVLLPEAAARLEIGNQRHPVADLLKVGECERHAGRAGHRGEYGVTAFVEPPTAMTTTMAFSNARRVMMSRGLRSSSRRLRTAAPAARHSSSLPGSSAGRDEL